MAEISDDVAQVIRGYARAAPALLTAYDALLPETVLEPVADFLPAPGAAVLDVGAGSGATASWLAAKGCRVTAIEPVDAFRDHARHTNPDAAVRWVNDTLPGLQTLRPLKPRYDAILAVGVLHHLTDVQQVQSVRTLSSTLAPSGRMILSLRHGPSPKDRPGYPIAVDKIIECAREDGLGLQHNSHRTSVQHGNRRAGVTWTWLVLGAPDHSA